MLLLVYILSYRISVQLNFKRFSMMFILYFSSNFDVVMGGSKHRVYLLVLCPLELKPSFCVYCALGLMTSTALWVLIKFENLSTVVSLNSLLLQSLFSFWDYIYTYVLPLSYSNFPLNVYSQLCISDNEFFCSRFFLFDSYLNFHFY